MSKKTHFYQQHLDAKAKIVDFGGWLMPVHYGSQLEEHHIIRQSAGMFDVSHMTILDMKGSDVSSYLQKMLANDIAKISGIRGKALYSCLLNQSGFVIDDLIVYYMNDEWFRVIVNASTREKDIQWFEDNIESFDVSIEERQDLAMLAVQGPKAHILVKMVLDINVDVKVFSAIEHSNLFIARTGYTGEDGFEIIIPADRVDDVWNALLVAGIKPCGLGARDTLRLEAGMNLYGNDMDETVSPLESGLSWTVDFKDASRQFIGREALEAQKSSGIKFKLVGLVLEGKGILRSHQTLQLSPESDVLGETTSGGFSPTMEKSIAFARVPKDWTDKCLVNIRKKQIPATIVKLPFVRNGKILIGN